MAEESGSLQRFVSLVEKYLLSGDRAAFLEGLPPASTDKLFFELIQTNERQRFKELAQILGLNGTDWIWMLRTAEILNSDATDEVKLKAMSSYSDILDSYTDYEREEQPNEENEDQQKEEGSSLTEDDYSVVALFNRHYRQGDPSSNVCSRLTKYGLTRIKIKQLPHLNARELIDYLDRADLVALEDHLASTVAALLPIIRKTNSSFQFKEDFFRRLTIKQLQALGKQLPEVLDTKYYCFQLFTKLFQERLTEANELCECTPSAENLLRKKDLLARIEKWLDGNNIQIFRSLRDQLLIESLRVDLLLRTSNVRAFIDHLTRPKNICDQFTDEYVTKTRQRTDYNYYSWWHEAHGFRLEGFQQGELVQDYLTMYFQEYPDIKNTEQFYPYLKKSVVDAAAYKAVLYAGGNPPDAEAVLTAHGLADLRDKREITILPTNKRTFSVDDKISLKLKVKNVQLLTAKIYEVDMLQSLLRTGKDIDETTDLSFFVPNATLVRKIDETNPFKQTIVDFPLESVLANKPSCYIVELMGEGIQSRAVIRRGGIFHSTKETYAGVEVSFFWDDGKPLSEVDIWQGVRKTTAKDKHIIPYGATSQKVELIVVKDAFAKLITVYVSQEDYKLTVECLYSRDSFIVGSTAKVLVRPRLTGNSHYPVTLKALKKCSITVKLTHQDSTPSSFTLNDVKFDHQNEYIVEVPIRSALKTLQVAVAGSVDKYDGKSNEVEDTWTMKLRQANSDAALFSLFLSKVGDSYVLRVLGRNGEPKANANITFRCASELFTEEFKVKEVRTNSRGQIQLGSLRYVSTLWADFSENNEDTTESWDIAALLREVDYPEELTVACNEQFSLPLPLGPLQPSIQLVRVNNQRSALSQEKESVRVERNRLWVTLKEVGTYTLTIGTSILNINVVKGNACKQGQFYDEKLGKLISFKNNTSTMIGFGDIKVEALKDETRKISIDLSLPEDVPDALLNDVRIHVVTSAFIDDQDYTYQNIGFLLTNFSKNTITSAKCTYFNNSEFSEEHCYVLARESSEKFMGNNLNKPQLLLKRTFVRETGTDKEVLKQGKDFEKKPDSKYSPNRGKYDKCSKDEKKKKKKRRADNSSDDQSSSSLPRTSEFLRYPSAIHANLHGKTVEFTVPAYHQICRVVLIAPFAKLTKLIAMKERVDICTRDLRQTILKDVQPNTSLNVSRQIYRLNPGESKAVSRSCQWRVVGPAKIDEYLRLRRPYSSVEYEWLLGWQKYSLEEKIRLYDQHCCHELNTYLRMRDPEFFEKVARKFIVNKLQKTVVDYCLLDDPRAEQYVSTEKLQQLNLFEKCLLVEFLVRQGKRDLAELLVKRMRGQFESNQLRGQKFAAAFDTVMKSQRVQPRDRDYDEDYGPGGGGGGGGPQMECCAAEEGEFGGEEEEEDEEEEATKRCKPNDKKKEYDDTYEQKAEQYIAARKTFKPAFIPVEKTKEYAEVTYYGTYETTDESRTTRCRFWLDLAQYLLKGDRSKAFLPQSFLQLEDLADFFMSLPFFQNESIPKFSIQTKDDQMLVCAQSALLLFVEEFKGLPYERRNGVLLNQRLYDPTDPHTKDEEGDKVSKPVENFVRGRAYAMEVAIVNASLATLDLQVLLAMPEGSIPLEGSKCTRVASNLTKSNEITSLTIKFYFPESGTFRVYAANVAKADKIVAKAEPTPDITVLDVQPTRKIDSLKSVIKYGSPDDIIEYLRTGNIFEEEFNPSNIYWMLKQKQYYEQIRDIFKARLFHQHTILSFSLLHEDIATAATFVTQNNVNYSELPTFEYFPLSAARAHRFMDSKKSTILNVEFRETYCDFVMRLLLQPHKQHAAQVVITWAYYLLLQDRVAQAQQLLARVKTDEPDFPQLQYDYLRCFLDLYVGQPECILAKDIARKYQNYPVPTWASMFKEVSKLFEANKEEAPADSTYNSIDFTVRNDGASLKLTVPKHGRIRIDLHAINLELMFSLKPFALGKEGAAIVPFKQYEFEGSDKPYTLERPSAAHDFIVVPSLSSSGGTALPKIEPFLWHNPAVKIRLLEDAGELFVFVQGKVRPRAYCKVYSQSNGIVSLVRDGYTDLRGRFVYLNSDGSEAADGYAILVMTEEGGVVKYARKPSTIGELKTN